MSNLNRKGPEEQGSMTGRKMGACTGNQFDEKQLAEGMGMRRKSQGNKTGTACRRKGRSGIGTFNSLWNRGKGKGWKCRADRGNGLRRNADVENQ